MVLLLQVQITRGYGEGFGGCPWYIAGKPFLIRKWQQNLKSENEFLKFQFGLIFTMSLWNIGLKKAKVT